MISLVFLKLNHDSKTVKTTTRTRCIWSLRVSFSKEKEGRKSREVVAFSWWLADGTGPSHPLEPSASSGQNRVKKANIWRIFFFFFNPQKVSNCNKRFFFTWCPKGKTTRIHQHIGMWHLNCVRFCYKRRWLAGGSRHVLVKRRRRWGFEKITHFVLLVAGCRRDVRLINWPAKAVERARRPEIMAVSHRLVLLARSRKTVICGRYRTNVTVNPLANNNNHRQIETKGNNKGITHTTILAVDLDQQNCTFH